MPSPVALDVLNESSRRAILDLLRDGERPVGDLVSEMGLSQPAVSKHLRVLKEAGLVEVRAEAQRRLYRINPEPLEALDGWLEPYRKLWSDRLDGLQAHPEQQEEEAVSMATITIGGPRPVVRLERRLPDPPAVVWRAITEREQLAAWFPCDVAVDGGRWEVGASISFPFPPEVVDMTLAGTVLAVDEPQLLSYSWGGEVLRFELAADGGGTLLVLHNELPPSAAARHAAGWEDCLDRLVGTAPVPDGWQAHFDAYRASFEPVLGPQEGPPEGYKGG